MSCWCGGQGFWALLLGTMCAPEDGQKFARNILSWSWRSIKLLLLHLVGVPYYFTYIDDARSHTNQEINPINFKGSKLWLFNKNESYKDIYIDREDGEKW
jgi:hypothetical protein